MSPSATLLAPIGWRDSRSGPKRRPNLPWQSHAHRPSDWRCPDPLPPPHLALETTHAPVPPTAGLLPAAEAQLQMSALWPVASASLLTADVQRSQRERPRSRLRLPPPYIPSEYPFRGHDRLSGIALPAAQTRPDKTRSAGASICLAIVARMFSAFHWSTDSRKFLGDAINKKILIFK
jgi:hypothetical protein